MSRQEAFLPPEEYAALKDTILSELQVRMRHKPAGATRCLFCIHIVFNTAGVPCRWAMPSVTCCASKLAGTQLLLVSLP